MIRHLPMALLATALTCFTAHAVSFDWATVGDVGNADDTHGNGFGGVDYVYQISKHEVTNAQYTEFLNAVAAADPNGLYSTDMATKTWGGITRSGTSGNYTYTVKGNALGQGPGGADGNDYSYANKPVVYVSFFDAMRFVNWLENGQPTGPQGPGTTEDGAYTITDGVSEVRNPNATYVLPSEDEWYKAAYYEPTSSVYYDYATSTSSIPDNNLPSADTGNSVNYQVNGLWTTGNGSYPLTDVGAYSSTPSPYGTFDQNGNVWEWTEAVIGASNRGLRGASWLNPAITLRPDYLAYDITTGERFNIGIRVAVIPEPYTVLMGLMAAGGLLLQRSK